MMKRLSLKGLRLSGTPRDVAGDAGDEGQEDSQLSPEILPTPATDDDQPGTPKKREKKGFFKTLKRKLTGNFKGKRDSVTGVVVVEEDSSSENARDDGSLLHCGPRAFHSPRRPPRPHSHQPPSSHPPQHPQVTPDHPGPGGDCALPAAKHQRHHSKHLQQPGKEEVSKSEEEESSTPTEEEKVQTVFLTDAEYGHASAPAPTTSTLPSAQPVDGPVSVSVVVSHPDVEVSAQEVSLPDSTWPQTPAPLPPPSPGLDSLGASDTELQGACAPRIAPRTSSDFPDSEDADLPPLPPPPPPTNAAQDVGYEPYDDSSETGFRGHLALVGGGITGDPSKLLPVYDQLKEPPKSWSLTKELFKLSKFGWYWGPITRVEAEEKLLSQTDGAFLVRDSSDERYLLSLSFRSYGRTLHTRIEHCNGVFSFYAQPESEGYYSIVDLIEHSMTDSQTGVFCYSRARTPGSPSFPVRLTKPVSRFTQVRSLQYLCRFVIRQYTRFDHIQKLPLPPRIKGWLEENQY